MAALLKTHVLLLSLLCWTLTSSSRRLMPSLVPAHARCSEMICFWGMEWLTPYRLERWEKMEFRVSLRTSLDQGIWLAFWRANPGRIKELVAGVPERHHPDLDSEWTYSGRQIPPREDASLSPRWSPAGDCRLQYDRPPEGTVWVCFLLFCFVLKVPHSL